MHPCLSPNGASSCSLNEPPTELLIATTNGAVRLFRAGKGAPWKKAGLGLKGKPVSCLISDKSGTVYAGLHSGGIYRSRDAGVTWEHASKGLSHSNVYSLAVASEPDGSEVLYAGTEPVSLYRSTNGADSWIELPSIAHVPGAEKWAFPGPPHQPHAKSLTIDIDNPRRIYAAIEQGGLLRTDDGGGSWIELDDYARDDDKVYRDVHRIVQAPWRSDLLFMTTGIGFFRSEDAGAHWEYVPALGDEIGYPDGMVVSPHHDHTLFVSGPKGNPYSWFESGGAKATVMRSRNEGRDWEPANAGLPTNARANIEAFSLASYPEGISLFVGNTDGEVYISEDLGDHWTKAAHGLAPVSKAEHHLILLISSAVPRILRGAFAAVVGGGLKMSARIVSKRRMKRDAMHMS